MTMISGGDEKARNAFRAKLRDEPSRPVLVPRKKKANATEELSPDDILEVHDLANAIARAEQIILAPASSRPRDIFDLLVAGEPKTDDCSGPALPADDDSSTTEIFAASAPVAPSSAPPSVSSVSPVSSVSRLSPPAPPSRPSATKTLQIARVSAPPSTAGQTLRMPVIYVDDEDAFLQPAGRMRSLADVTLDGYRPEPTLLVRIRNRRKSLSWMVAAILVPLALLAGGSAMVRTQTPAAHADVGPTSISTLTASMRPETTSNVEAPKPESPKVETTSLPANPANAEPPAKATPASPAKPADTKAADTKASDTKASDAKTGNTKTGDTKTAETSGVPVFDVNSLPAAPTAPTSHASRSRTAR